ncbi:helix-turn-helix domain-containing protein [Salinispora arenicola]|uniref:helix-turn-helix domain-containing protein n=1 Tax=Salinispora arenicola TaxID=168697 RepID=UPI00355776EE
MPTLLTADEAATILRVKASWLERHAASRKIPFTMLGGCYRFTTEHIRRIVEIFEASPRGVGESTELTRVRRSRARKQSGGETRPSVTPLRPRPREARNPQQDAA